MSAEETAKYVEGEQRGGVLVLRICPSHIQDPEMAYGIRDQMIALVDQAGVKHAAIDFNNVRFMGSIGFLALMSLRRHLSDGRIVLFGLSDDVRAVFVACRLVSADGESPSVFGEVDSQAAAVDLLEG